MGTKEEIKNHRKECWKEYSEDLSEASASFQVAFYAGFDYGLDYGLEYQQVELAELEYQNSLLKDKLEHEKNAFDIAKLGYELTQEKVNNFVEAIRNYFSAEDKEAQTKALIALNEVYDREIELRKKGIGEIAKEVESYFKTKGETQ